MLDSSEIILVLYPQVLFLDQIAHCELSRVLLLLLLSAAVVAVLCSIELSSLAATAPVSH